MNNGLVILGALAVAALVAAAKCRKAQTDDPDIEDGYVSADNIREGVQNGWYNAVLVRRDGQPFVRVTGNNVNGEYVDELFHITQEDFDELQADGFLIEL